MRWRALHRRGRHHVDSELISQLGVPLLLAVVATGLITPPLLFLYRRRVSLWMGRKAGEAPPPALPQSPSRALLPASDQLRRRSRAAVWARAGWVLAMGLFTGAFGFRPGPLLWLARIAGLAAGLGLGVWLLRGVAERQAPGVSSAPLPSTSGGFFTPWCRPSS